MAPSGQGKHALQPEVEALVKELKPRPPVAVNCVWAFVVGGLICTVGQLITDLLTAQGISLQDARNWTSIILIGAGGLATGLGVYDELGQRAGAGSIVPITGFANSIVAAAMEYRREGLVLGVGARMFTIAGPVLVFGFITAVAIALIKMIVG